MTIAPEKNKLALFVCHDLIGLLILNRLVPALCAQGWRPCVFNTTNKRNRQFKVPPPAIPSFFGAGIVHDGLLPYLDAGRRCHLGAAPITEAYSYKELSARFDLLYQEQDDINDPEFYNKILDDHTYAGAISIRFLQIFEKPLIDLFSKKGFFWNLHGGILPDYKGLLIPYRVLQNNEEDYGWTLHHMDYGLDEGAAIRTCTIKIDRQTPIFDDYMEMVPMGSEMILGALSDYAAARQESKKKILNSKTRDVTYYPYPSEEEMNAYEREGIRFIGSPFDHVEFIVKNFASLSDQQDQTRLRDALIASIRRWSETIQDKESLFGRSVRAA